MHAIWIDKPGGLDVLSYRECAQPEPNAGEVLVKIAAIGVNFIDVYYRTGLYAASYPFISRDGSGRDGGSSGSGSHRTQAR